MKKVAIVFVLAVIAPSLVLAWLAALSLRDQQFALERQQTLLYQGVTDTLAKTAGGYLAGRQREFAQQVDAMLAGRKAAEIAGTFHDRLCTNWPAAEVGFVVTMGGALLCPPPNTVSLTCVSFNANNGDFLGNRQSAQVYWNAANGSNYVVYNVLNQQAINTLANKDDNRNATLSKAGFATNSNLRSVVPQQQSQALNGDNVDQAQYSKVAPAEAEFRQLIGDSTEGTVARFLENKLNLLFWYRPPADPQYVFGAQISLPELKAGLKEIVSQFDPALRGEIVTALLDDAARPVALSTPGYLANWKHPLVATEIGETLPHWEMAIYLQNPAKLTQSAQTLRFTLGMLIALLLLAIGVGSWLIVNDLNRQLRLARQKTDFVSNVSHELKTPLTSIRMFSELLAEGQVSGADKQRSYLNIITAEAARLTRLINNVLDFSRLERGEKKYNHQRCDLVEVVRETVETYRPHLESSGFKLDCEWPAEPLVIKGDRDALAQIVVNLLSNAEKYSNGHKEILVQVQRREATPPAVWQWRLKKKDVSVEVECSEITLPCAEVRVLDRGPGVPSGCEEKIFEQFYRAHDSLSSGVQGSGLGLTLARQIARAHGGDVVYQPRDGGGSSFSLCLPLENEA